MTRKKTREELEREIDRLKAYEEAFYALRQGNAGTRGPQLDGRETTFSSGEGDDECSISVVGLARAAGGVVVSVNGVPCVPVFLTEWCQRIEANRAGYGPYALGVVAFARRAQADAVWMRMQTARGSGSVIPGSSCVRQGDSNG